MAERTVDDPTLLQHQSVDDFDTSIVGQICTNAILDLDVLVVVAILAIDGVSIFVVDVFVVVVVVVVDVVDPLSLVIVEAVVFVGLDATQVWEIVQHDVLDCFDVHFANGFAVVVVDVVDVDGLDPFHPFDVAEVRFKYCRMISSMFSRIMMLIS